MILAISQSQLVRNWRLVTRRHLMNLHRTAVLEDLKKYTQYTIYIYINTKVSSRRPKLASHLKPPGSFLDLTALFLSLNVCRFCLLVLYFGGTVVPGEVFLLLLLIHLHSSCTHLFTALITCTRLQRTEASAPEYRRSPPRCYGSSEISWSVVPTLSLNCNVVVFFVMFLCSVVVFWTSASSNFC